MIKKIFGKKDDPDQTLEKLLEKLNKRGRSFVVSEFNEIEVTSFPGTFEHFYKEENQSKNCKKQILCFDHSRVKLSIINNDSNSDYIHANFVDGYQQQNEFIITQAPLQNTCADFWRMVWEQHVLVIVILAQTLVSSPNRIFIYWPEFEPSVKHGFFLIANKEGCQNTVFKKFFLTNTLVRFRLEWLKGLAFPSLNEIYNDPTNEVREIVLFMFKHWPDHKVPVTCPLLQFREKVRKIESEMFDLLKSQSLISQKPPILVHCFAGLGRSGTFVALDISLLKLEAEGLVNVKMIVEKIRKQRFGAVQTEDQYVFIYKGILEWAVYKNIIQVEQLNKLNL